MRRSGRWILLVHQRLGERRLVALVVAVPAVADHVDDDVLAERLAELERQLGDVDDRLGILAVDVEDRHLDHLGDVGAVARRAGVAGRGGEADLVVDDDVDRAAGACSRAAATGSASRPPALAGEGRVAVDQERHAQLAVACRLNRRCLARVRPSTTGLTASRWLGLGVSDRWIVLLVGRDVVGREAQVVLDVAVAGDRLGQVFSSNSPKISS